MKRAIIAILFSTVLLGWIAVTQASAQEELPPWVNEKNCPADLQNSKGLTFCVSDESGKGKVYVIVVDLHSPGIEFEYIIARGWNPKKTPEPGYEPCQDVNVPSNQRPGPWLSRER